MRRHARREASVVCICSGGAVEGRVAAAMTEGEGEQGSRRGRMGSRYRRNVVVVAYVQGLLTRD